MLLEKQENLVKGKADEIRREVEEKVKKRK